MAVAMDLRPQIGSTRQLTQRNVMQLLLQRGPMSRADLARALGVSKQTTSEVIRELESEEWVRHSGRTKGAVGRSAITYEVQADRALVFGADVGGTKVHAALADMNGVILTESTQPIDPRGGEHVVAQIASLCTDLAQETGLPVERVTTGTIGIPGAVNSTTRQVFMVPNIAGLEGVSLADGLEAHLDFEVHVANDVNMAAKGEQWHGQGRDVDTFVFIAIGTGIGMGIINERRVLSGARGAAGEISTLPTGADPYDTRTFHAGALETTVGSAAIRARYEASGGIRGLTVREIIDRIAQGDAGAKATLDAVARTIAEAILAVTAVLDPEVVILGGSIGARSELLLGIRHYLPLCMPNPPACTVSELGSRAGLYGTIANSLDIQRASLFNGMNSAPPSHATRDVGLHP